MNWTKDEYNSLRLRVAIKTHAEQPDAFYDIIIARRPWYCDRGDWQIFVDGRNDLDGADGFPRYFFGSEAEVKAQMETWLNRRAAYRKTLNETKRLLSKPLTK